MRKYALPIILVLVLLSTLGGIALGAYALDIVVTENGTATHAMLGCNHTLNIAYMASHDFCGSQALDTRVVQGSAVKPHMPVSDRLMFAVPVGISSSQALQFTTGSTNLTDFHIIPGYSANSTVGYVSVADNNTNLELGDNFTIEQVGWVDTTYEIFVENFLTYTEEDDNNKLTVTATKAEGADVDRDIDVWLYADKGSDYFDALDIDFEIYVASTSLDGGTGGIAITNTANKSVADFADTDISVLAMREGADYKLKLWRGYNVDDDAYTGSSNTLYYCTLSRAAGNDSVSVPIYSDVGRTDLLGTITVVGFGTTKYQYVYGFVNINAIQSGKDFDGYVQNLDLTGGVDKNLVGKQGAFRTYVSATGNITSTMAGGIVTATGISSGERKIVTTADTANLTISVYDANDDLIDGNSTALTANVTDTDANWIFLQNNVMPYCDNMTIEIDGVQQLWFDPDDIITGVNLPDRSVNSNNGTFHWGSNPAGVAITLGSLDPDYEPAVVGPGLETPDVAPGITEPATMYPADVAMTAAMVNDPLYVFFKVFSDASGISILLMWWMTYMGIALLAFLVLYKHTHNLLISGSMLIAVFGYAVNRGIMPFWIVLLAIMLLAGFLVLERRQQL